MARHQKDAISPAAALRCFGGAETAAMTGFLLAAARWRLPVFVDGFCATAAALAARGVAPDALDTMLFAGCSTDPAWVLALATLGVTPLLQLEAEERSGFHGVLALHLVASVLLSVHTLTASLLAQREWEAQGEAQQ